LPKQEEQEQQEDK